MLTGPGPYNTSHIKNNKYVNEVTFAPKIRVGGQEKGAQTSLKATSGAGTRTKAGGDA